MKRFLLTALLTVVLLVGCTAKAETESYSLKDEMHNMSTYLGDKNNVVDVDVTVLNDFFGEVDAASYRLYGMVTDYKEETKQGIMGTYTANVCDLIRDGLRIRVYFADSETTANGEYIEVVGELFTISNTSFDESNFSLWEARITERGASVRERIEQTP